jgi:hypothetical protein
MEWEYLESSSPMAPDDEARCKHLLLLNDLGGIGWELVTILMFPQLNTIRSYFKRRKATMCSSSKTPPKYMPHKDQ